MPFVENYPIAQLRPAPYNPRVIDDDAIDALRASIRLTGGLAKPLIATKDGTLVAGHQRARAAAEEGLETAPVFVLTSKCNRADEARFNQLHNGSDVDKHRDVVTVPPGPLGYGDVAPADVKVGPGAPGATIRKEICEMLLRHGQWGGVVATAGGRILSAPQYAIACKMLAMPCRVYRVDESIAEQVCAYFDRQYGHFDYSKIERETWRQSFAQPLRFRAGVNNNSTRKEQRSALYDAHLLRRVTPNDRVLDFGCGQGDYVKMLRGKGYNIHGIEFFYRNDTHLVHEVATRAMIDATLKEFSDNGPFDAVISDYVLNSVDTPQAEADVLTCINAMVKIGGLVCLSTRMAMDDPDATRAMGMVRRVEFLDKGGFTAIHWHGGWFFQRRHTKPEMDAMAVDYFGDDAKSKTHNSSCLALICRKRKELDSERVEASLRREFDLPWARGSVGRADEAVAAWRSAMTKTVMSTED